MVKGNGVFRIPIHVSC